MHSMTRGRYLLLWAEGERQKAVDALGINYDVMWLREKRRRMASKGEYVIVIDRTESMNLGVQCEPFEAFLTIRGVVSDGLVSKWNEANLDARVEVGDQIMEVNNIRGKSELL